MTPEEKLISMLVDHFFEMIISGELIDSDEENAEKPATSDHLKKAI